MVPTENILALAEGLKQHLLASAMDLVMAEAEQPAKKKQKGGKNSKGKQAKKAAGRHFVSALMGGTASHYRSWLWWCPYSCHHVHRYLLRHVGGTGVLICRQAP